MAKRGRKPGQKNGQAVGIRRVGKNGKVWYAYPDRAEHGRSGPGGLEVEQRPPVRSLADHPLRADREPSRARPRPLGRYHRQAVIPY